MTLTNESVWLKHLSGCLMQLTMWGMSFAVWLVAFLESLQAVLAS